MYKKLIWNDLKQHWVQTLNIALFIMLSVAFLSAAGQLCTDLVLSMNHLFEMAKTPHLLQMHKGTVDFERLDDFVREHDAIASYQVSEFWNVDNADLYINAHSMKDSIYDNGFSIQSEHFDFLYDLSDTLIQPNEGEVYVPLYYYTSGLAKVGDELRMQGMKQMEGENGEKSELILHIVGFVRDSQMNSSISVSRRFIVHPLDLERIASNAELEYLIAFRLHDTKDSAAIEAAYITAGLESNGPPFMSVALFRLVNSFSDGISIMALLFISMLVIAISILCIRLTLLSKMEEEEKEIAVLRAIGIDLHTIKRLFLSKYLFIACVASIFGFLLSFGIKFPFLLNMKMFFGEMRWRWQSIAVAILLSFLVLGMIVWSMIKMANALKDISMLTRARTQKEHTFTLRLSLPRWLKLSVSDLAARWKIYKTMVFVIVLSVFVITVPMSMYMTVSDSGFIRYLGLGNYDIRADLTQIDSKKEQQAFFHQLAKDEAIAEYEVYTGKRMKVLESMEQDAFLSKESKTIWVDLGVSEAFQVLYIDGVPPASVSEIALSRLKAKDLEKNVGDTLILLIDDVPTKLRVCGIYSDLTNGGKTAKAIFEAKQSETIWQIVPIRLKQSEFVREWILRYQEEFLFVKFSDVDVYSKQIFGNTIAMTAMISKAAFLASILLVFLITFLFMHMLYLKDFGQNALLKSIGFSNRFLYLQYLFKASFILVLGCILGYLLSFTIGEWLGTSILDLIGVSGVHFVKDYRVLIGIVPPVLWLTTISATMLGVWGVKDLDISQWMKEEI